MIRPGTNNPALGLPLFTSVSDTALIAPGTIAVGFDDSNSTNAEYIYLQSPANIVPGDEVTYTFPAYLATEVAAGSGQAVAIVTPAVNQYCWYRLKRRGVIA